LQEVAGLGEGVGEGEDEAQTADQCEGAPGKAGSGGGVAHAGTRSIGANLQATLVLIAIRMRFVFFG